MLTTLTALGTCIDTPTVVLWVIIHSRHILLSPGHDGSKGKRKGKASSDKDIERKQRW